MWNKLVEILQNSSYKRLLLALCVSVALHALLFDGFNILLPNFKKEMHVIEARIQMPKVVLKPAIKPDETPIPVEAPESKPEPKPKLEPEPQPEPQTEPEPKPEPLAEVKPEAPSEPAPELIAENTAPVIAEVVPIPPPVTSEPAPAPAKPEPTPQLEPEPAQTPQPVDAGLVINESAYQYVETEFDVRTEIDGAAVGRATITYNLMDGRFYQLKWLTEGRGLAALIFPDLLQTSEGLLTNTGLQPNKYIYQFGNKTDKTRTASFDWPNKTITLQTSKGMQTVNLQDGTQDLLSFMYQFMFVAPLQTMQIAIATGKKLAIYDYSFEGEESLNIKIGELKTMHIVHSGGESDEKTELWLAIDYQYVPVKIRKIEKNGDVVEMVATRINTNRPTVNN